MFHICLLTTYVAYARFISVMETTEQDTKKLQALTMLDPELFAIVERFKNEEDRSMSNMISNLLKTHPRIQPILEGQSAEVAA
jgi:hypothetical protein